MNFVQMSAAGGCAIAAIIAVRALGRNRLPAWTFPALWWVATLRLLLPFAISAPAGLRHWMEGVPTGGLAVMQPAPSAGVSQVGAAASRPDPWFLVWALGAALLALLFLLARLHWRKIFQSAAPVDCAFVRNWQREHPLRRNVRILQSNRVSAPLTWGALRPAIVMPADADWSDGETLRFVLAHEYAHIRRFDALAKHALALALCVHWFNPLAWAMYLLANRDIEVACDEAVVRAIPSGDGRKRYALALLRMEDRRSPATVNGFSNNATEERIKRIMKMKKTSLVAALAACMLIACMATALAAAPEQAPTTSDARMSALALERLEARYPQVAAWAREQYPDAIWWTYEGYKAQSEARIDGLAGQIGANIGTNSSGDVIVSQAMIDEFAAEDAEVLRMLADGYMVSKSMGGDENLGGAFDPRDIANSSVRELTYAFLLKDGTEAVFGPYGTEAEMLDVLEPYCAEQVAAGNLDPSEAEEVLEKLGK